MVMTSWDSKFASGMMGVAFNSTHTNIRKICDWIPSNATMYLIIK
jgi:hypothetical protein